MAREIIGGIGLASGADRGQLAAIFGTLRGKIGVFVFGYCQQAIKRGEQRPCVFARGGSAQEYPRTFAPPVT